MDDHAGRRELLTEVAAAAGFGAMAVLAWAAFGFPAPGWAAVWLTILCAILVRVEFLLEEGHTRPVVLAFVPMLVLLPAPVVPLLVAAAHVAARVPEVVTRRAPPSRLVMMLADCWFTLPAALLVAAVGLPAGPAGAVVLVLACTVTQIGVDFGISALRLWAAPGLPRKVPHTEPSVGLGITA